MLAIISDIHGNYPALLSVFDKIDKLGCTKIISLGDVVGYYTLPHKCIDLLMERNVLNLLGNHDKYLINDGVCSRSSFVTSTLQNHKKLLNKQQFDWLSKSLSKYIEANNFFVHGGFKENQEQYLYEVSIADFPYGIKNMFTGHTHVQSLLRFDNQTHCNPGSVGQPRDGDPRAAFAVLKNDKTINLHRVEYDIDKIAYDMKKAGYEPFSYENLYQGTQIGGRVDTVKKEN